MMSLNPRPPIRRRGRPDPFMVYVYRLAWWVAITAVAFVVILCAVAPAS